MESGQPASEPAVPSGQVTTESTELTNEPLETFEVECAEGEHELQTPWSWWFDKKMKTNSAQLTEEDFKANMQHLGTVHSVEQALQYYKSLAKPSALPTDTNLHLMRYNTYPMWEAFPMGGCWLIKFTNHKSKKNREDHDFYQTTLDSIWEQLVYSAIGEAFGEPDLIGVSLSIRSKGVVLSLWNMSPETEFQNSRAAIGEKVKEIVQNQPFTSIEYKYHNQSMRDRSSFRNARPYIIVATESTEPLSPVPEPQAAALEPAPVSAPLNTSAEPFKLAPAAEPAEPEPAAAVEAAVEAAEEPAAAEEAQAEEAAEPAKLSFAEMAKRRQNEAKK